MESSDETGDWGVTGRDDRFGDGGANVEGPAFAFCDDDLVCEAFAFPEGCELCEGVVGFDPLCFFSTGSGADAEGRVDEPRAATLPDEARLSSFAFAFLLFSRI